MNNATERYSFASICARSVCGVALASAMVLPGVGAVGVGQAWADDTTDKDEVVYVKGAADGATQGIYVVNVFDTENAESVNDPANYTSVSNLTTNEALSETDGTVALTTTAGEPFYYQGEMDSATQLPWNITVKYYLNGEEVQPADLQGADGLLKVVFDVQALDDGSSTADFASSYLLQAQGTFAEENFAIADAGDATLARSGSDEVVTCLVLPGESATFEVSGIASNFHYDGWQVAGMPLSMAINIADQDTSQLTDACNELEDATTKLTDGGETLFDGTDTLSDGATQVASGASDVAAGANELSAGVDSAVAGLSNLSTAGKSVATGWQSVYAGIGTLKSNLVALKAGSDTFSQALGTQAANYSSQAQVEAATAAYQQALQAVLADPTDQAAQAQLNTAVTQLAAANQAAGAAKALTETKSSYDSQIGANIGALASNTELENGAAQFDSGLTEFLGGATSAADQASALSSGAASLAEGANQVADGADQVADGATSLQDGASQLASGNKTLAESVDGMDQEILDQLQETIDEKLGGDFNPHSFVVPSNTNVDDVQFVYVIEGVSEAEDDADSDATDEEESTEDETFFDRLFALFQ